MGIPAKKTLRSGFIIILYILKMVFFILLLLFNLRHSIQYTRGVPGSYVTPWKSVANRCSDLTIPTYICIVLISSSRKNIKWMTVIRHLLFLFLFSFEIITYYNSGNTIIFQSYVPIWIYTMCMRLVYNFFSKFISPNIFT